MREALFRGMTESKEWVYGSLITKNSLSDKQVFITIPLGHIAFTGDALSSSVTLYKVCPETVGQHIELKDKAGVKYFEGDKARFDNGDKFILKREQYLSFYADWIDEPECEDQTRDLYRIENATIYGTIHDK